MSKCHHRCSSWRTRICGKGSRLLFRHQFLTLLFALLRVISFSKASTVSIKCSASTCPTLNLLKNATALSKSLIVISPLHKIKSLWQQYFQRSRGVENVGCIPQGHFEPIGCDLLNTSFAHADTTTGKRPRSVILLLHRVAHP